MDETEEFYAPITLSYDALPCNAEVAERLALPWGAVIKPFMEPSSNGLAPDAPVSMQEAVSVPRAQDIARCANCFAYINPHCKFMRRYWTCALCGVANVFSQLPRYKQGASFTNLVELNSQLVEFKLDVDAVGVSAEQIAFKEQFVCPATAKPLVHVFVLDETGDIPFVEAVSDSLASLLTHMHDDMYVALVTYSSRMGVFQLRSQTPSIHYMHFCAQTPDGLRVLLDPEDWAQITSETSIRTATSLQNISPFMHVCGRVGDCREQIQAAVRSLFDTLGGDSTVVGAPAFRLTLEMLEALVEWILPSADILKRDVLFPSSTLDRLKAFFGSSSSKRPSNAIVEDPLLQSGRGCTGVSVHVFLSNDHISGMVSGHNTTSVNARYAELAGRCATNGVCFNTWVIETSAQRMQRSMGVNEDSRSLYSLVKSTGGNILKFTLDDTPFNGRQRITAEILKRILTRTATKCLLKIRASPQIKVGALGHIHEDPALPSVWHMSNCSPQQAVGVNFDFTDASGFRDSEVGLLQVAFVYSTVLEVTDNTPGNPKAAVQSWRDAWKNHIASALAMLAPVDPLADKNTSGSESDIKDTTTAMGQRTRLVVVRRIRVLTCCLNVCQDARRLREGVHLPTVVSLLARQAAMEVLISSQHSACKLIEYWIINFFIEHLQELQKHQGSNRVVALQKPIALLSSLDGEGVLNSLPQSVCALLLKSCFTMRANSEENAERGTPGLLRYNEVAELNMLLTMDASSTLSYIYPTMRGVSDSGALLPHPVRLSRQAITTSAHPFFMFLSANEIAIYQSLPDVFGQTFKDTKLNDSVESTRVSSVIQTHMCGAPQVPVFRIIRAGTTEATRLQMYLMDDRTVPGTSDTLQEHILSLIRTAQNSMSS